MSVSSESDPEGGQGSAGVTGVAAERGGEVDRPRLAEHADDQVAQAGHDVGACAGADLGGVLTEGDVAKAVQRLDRPVPAQQVGVGQARAGLANWNGRLVMAYTVTVCHRRRRVLACEPSTVRLRVTWMT
jgi:hypothetical protein